MVQEGVEELFPSHGWAAYRFLRFTVGTALKTVYRISVEGADNVPASGPAILAPNHASTLDPAFIPIVLKRRVAFLAKAEYWDRLRTRFFLNLGGQLPVQREDASQAKPGLDAAQRMLDLGGLIALHPEGTRSPDGRLYKGRTGVARLAAATGAPVIPIGLLGTHEIWAKGRRVPRLHGRVTVRFGQPLCIGDGAADDAGALRTFVDRLMRAIQQLSGQEYLDEYSSAFRDRDRTAS